MSSCWSAGTSPKARARWTVRATSSHMTAALMAARALSPMLNTPWACMSTAGERCPESVATTPRPISSPPMRANGPTGIGPPNSSAIAVSTHGIASPRAAHAVDDVRVEVDDDHRLGRELLERHAARLDHDEVLAGDPRRHVPARPRHQPVAHELLVERADRPPQLVDKRSHRASVSVHKIECQAVVARGDGSTTTFSPARAAASSNA